MTLPQDIMFFFFFLLSFIDLLANHHIQHDLLSLASSSLQLLPHYYHSVNIPSPPCLSNDLHLLQLQPSNQRSHYGPDHTGYPSEILKPSYLLISISFLHISPLLLHPSTFPIPFLSLSRQETLCIASPVLLPAPSLPPLIIMMGLEIFSLYPGSSLSP